MGFLQVTILAVVQGLTEFLPVSSSGHLVILQKLFNLSQPPVLFDILVHVGTLGAVIIYFRKELVKISRQTIWMVVIGTIPAAIVGLFLQGYIKQIFDSLRLVGLTLLVTAGFLFSEKGISRKMRENKGVSRIDWVDAIIVGLFQALAILPGISRSGSTIVSGLWRKFNRETAFRFSFYLAIPAILGALILQLPELLSSTYSYFFQGILGMFIAGAVGYGALKILEKFLLQARLWIFGIYCLVVGIGVLLL